MKIGDKLTEKEKALILNALEKLSDKYVNFAFEALNKGNMQANIIHSAEASGFGRAKWIVEDWLEQDEQKEADHE
jgi:hypothetical protein